jgi:small subunit ribosomal protein S1
MSDLFDDESSGAGAKDSSDFAKLFEESLKGVNRSLSVGDKVHGEILSIGKEEVFVSTGTMHDGIVMKLDMLDADGKFNNRVGDVLDFFVTQVRGSQIFLSRKPTSKNLADDLEDAFDMELPVEGKVTEICNGGVRVLILGKTAFCPISQLDLRRIDSAEEYIGRKFEFRITQFTPGGRNIVVSRRKLLEEEKELSQGSFLDDHKVGDTVTGVITRLEKFGAFVELSPGMDGLVHISEISWTRLADPSEAVKVGEVVQAKILKVEEAGSRLNISLSMKQVMVQPWENMPKHIQVGSVVEGKVTKCLKFGAFVAIAPGIEGLVPLSEMSDTKRVTRSDEIIKEGDTVKVLVKEIRADDRKLLLSLKEAKSSAETDEWRAASAALPKQASMGTLGEQFKGLFGGAQPTAQASTKTPVENKKK